MRAADRHQGTTMSGISSHVFDQMVADLAARIQPASLLDIGPGQGKYGRMVKAANPHCHSCAVEIADEYVKAYGLADLYDEVVVGDGAALVHEAGWRNRTFDLVTIGDCIEHMPKSQGLDLLNFLTYRCGYLIVIAPEFCWYDTDTAQMQHTESHISVWSEYDFAWHDRFAFMRGEIMQIFILRGYQQSRIALHDLVAAANTAATPVRSFAGQDYKTCALELRIRDRIERIDGTDWTYRHA